MSDAIPSDHQYKAKWRWPEDIENAVREVATGYTLNICCGLSPLGDVRVDASKDPAGLMGEEDPRNPEDLNNALAAPEYAPQPTMVADMKSLPFEDNTFETTIFDPPWKMAYLHRYKPFYEAVRVTKVGGIVVVNAKWPCESDHTRIINPFDTEGDDEVLIVQTDDPWRDASIVAFHEVVSTQADLGNWMGDQTDAVPARPNLNQWAACQGCGEKKPVDDLPYESAYADFGERFCSEDCRREFEHWYETTAEWEAND